MDDIENFGAGWGASVPDGIAAATAAAVQGLPPDLAWPIAVRACLRAAVVIRPPRWLDQEKARATLLHVLALPMVLADVPSARTDAVAALARRVVGDDSPDAPEAVKSVCRLAWSYTGHPEDIAAQAIAECCSLACRAFLAATKPERRPAMAALWGAALQEDLQLLHSGKSSDDQAGVGFYGRPLFPAAVETQLVDALFRESMVRTHDMAGIGQLLRGVVLGGQWTDLRRDVASFSPVPMAKAGWWRMPDGMLLGRSAGEDERSLNVEAVADEFRLVLTEVVHDNEECTVGLFGAWGAGKSYLMQLVVESLPGSYTAVRFNASKYPGLPQLWVHLYETLVDRMAAEGPVSRYARAARTGVERYGIGPVLILLATICWAATSLLAKAQMLYWLLSVLTLPIVLLLFGLLFRARRLVPQLVKQYLMVRRHGENLGLQAVIGEDLRSLLIGWIPPAGVRLARCGQLVLYVAATALAVYALCGWEIPTRERAFVAAVFAGLTLIAAALFIGAGTHTRKLLLVVDDLDRCEPAQMLAVIESLRLMLDDPEVRGRVQVVMLVQDEVLRVAVAGKYGAATLAVGDGAAQTEGAAKVWRETLEKLFLFYLRLHPLEDADLMAVLDLWVGRDRRSAEAVERRELERKLTRVRATRDAARDALAAGKVTEVVRYEEQEPLRMVRGMEVPGPSRKVPVYADRAMTKAEQDAERKRLEALNRETEEAESVLRDLSPSAEPKAALRAATRSEPRPARVFWEEDEVAILREARRLRQVMSPIPCTFRSVRAFLLRYQLAKRLLRAHNVVTTPGQLAKALVDAMGDHRTWVGRAAGREASDMDRVIRQVV